MSGAAEVRAPSAWGRALQLARETPDARNRYVDLLRAVSIAAVVLGHWLIAAPWIDEGRLRLDHMLGLQPWTQWLTLGFQVMPVFFLVGGYSNAASWDAARRTGRPYGAWLTERLRRLIGPVLPLLAVWAALAVLARAAGVGPALIREGSKLSLVPLWFLAVYVAVVLLAPLTRRVWQRFGIASFWALVGAAVLVDVARFWGGHRPAIGWLNYLLVWLAVHQLGYLWRDGGLAGPRRALPWAVGGAVSWALLARFGPYPVSMVGVPGEEVSNTLPPDIMLVALAAAQTGLLLAIEAPLRRWLARTTPWAATVLVNGTIMSVYLWHLTAMALLIGLANLLGGVGLGLRPGSAAWWLSRPLWLVVLLLGLVLLLALFGRFERPRVADPAAALPAWRGVVGSVLVCASLAMLALDGIATIGPPGIRIGVLAWTVVGALLLRVGPRPRAHRRE